jgi:enamine deaminase RidA (YjgF/YER057c/UK114 family)
MTVQTLNPPSLYQPDSYRQVAIARGSKLVCLSGQIALDASGALVGPGDLSLQTEQVYANIVAGLAAAGAGFGDVVKLTAYVVDWTPDKMEGLIAGATRAAQRLGFDPRTAMTMVGISQLAAPQFLIEVEAMAMID